MKSLPLGLFLLIAGATGVQSQQSRDQIRHANVKRMISVVGIMTKPRVVSDYDQRGNLIRRVAYGPIGSPRWEETYRYDDKDNLVEAVVDGKRQTYISKFDDKGKVLDVRELDAEGRLKRRIEFRRDGAANVTEQSQYGTDGKLLERQSNKYQNNLVSETLVHGADGKLTMVISYEYEGDRLLRKSTHDPSGKLLRRNAYKYNEKGLVIDDLQTNDKGEVIDRTTSEYEFYSLP